MPMGASARGRWGRATPRTAANVSRLSTSLGAKREGGNGGGWALGRGWVGDRRSGKHLHAKAALYTTDWNSHAEKVLIEQQTFAF